MCAELKESTVSKIILGLLLVNCILAFGQQNGVPTNQNQNINKNQPLVVIDATQLINSQKNKPQVNTGASAPTPPSKTETPTVENNVRIGSNGQYLDNSKSEQINSKGQICTTVSGKKTCN